MSLRFSIIVPVYNRPEELEQLLDSLLHQTYTGWYEVVVVEDGSTLTSEMVIGRFSGKGLLSYYKKENTGPGDSRNFGAQRAHGNYLIFLDSDCIAPPHYLEKIHTTLSNKYADVFGAPDTSHPSFSIVQKAINYAMTSFITTGGIRGHKKAGSNYQPRSFNMGVSKEAFQKAGGFSDIHPGEDPDLAIRLKENGCNILFIQNGYVYHKRRISWKKFRQQLYRFSVGRAIVNSLHPQTQKITYWVPFFFTIGFMAAIVAGFLGWLFLSWLYLLFFILIFADAGLKNKNLRVGIGAVYATWLQFTVYGIGFIWATILLKTLKKSPREIFPGYFFSKNKPGMVVGLTGGIGSGKSTVARLFKELGVPVYMADEEARRLMEENGMIREKIIQCFGPLAYHDGTPNRKFLASVVFNDPEKLQQLSAIIHPAVHRDFTAWYQLQKAPYVLKEAAILFETGSYRQCDRIITVTAPLRVRIKRVMERDGVTKEMVLARMSHQWNDKKKITHSHFVIKNKSLAQLKKQVETLHQLLASE